MIINKIITGGQTGADRAGLDAAIELNIPIGGWCPKGRKRGSEFPYIYDRVKDYMKDLLKV